MKAIILVGGEGTRLRPLTLNCLKGTVPMAGRPFLEYQFAWLRRHGVREVTLSICHMPVMIKRAFGDGSKYGIRLHYAVEKKPLGTAGAVKNAEQFVLPSQEPVVVLNGDVLTDFDLTRMAILLRKNRAALMLGLSWVEDPTPYGLVQTHPSVRVLRFVEKPTQDEGGSHWINAGVYLFDPLVFNLIPANVNYSAERGLFPAVLNSDRRMWAFPSRSYWMDIGTPVKYHQANMDILEGRMFMLPVGATWRRNAKVRVGSKNKIHPTAALSAPAVIGEHCVVGDQARVGEFTVLGNGVQVGAHAQIQRSVIWDQVQIGEGSHLSGCIIGAGARIGRYVTIRPGGVLGNNAVIPDYSQV